MARTEIENITPDTYLTSHETGKLLQMNPSSINKWVKEKRIECFRTPGGHRRIKAADLVAFLKQHKMPIPARLDACVASQPPKRATKKR